LKEEVLDRTVWRIRFGRSYETVVRQTAEWMNEWMTGRPAPETQGVVCCVVERSSCHQQMLSTVHRTDVSDRHAEHGALIDLIWSFTAEREKEVFI
jgi:hypothetical protein